MSVKTITSLGGYITTAEAAAILGVRDDYMYKLLKMGAISAVRVGNKQGGTLLFKKSDVDELAMARPHLGARRRVIQDEPLEPAS